MHLLDSFSGGVLLAAGLVHMLPDAVEEWETVAPDMEFPFIYCLCMVSIVVFISLEHVILRDLSIIAIGTSSPQQKRLNKIDLHAQEAAAAAAAEPADPVGRRSLRHHE